MTSEHSKLLIILESLTSDHYTIDFDLPPQQCNAILHSHTPRAEAGWDVESDMDTVAGKLNMTTRTLRRKLADEGVSFQQLKIGLRQDQAINLLGDNVQASISTVESISNSGSNTVF